MAKIKIMNEILANKIAAGEVVERCASVVKELVENSIDAKSTMIKVELTEAGTKEIKVTDNGSGMDKEDAVLAFNRHATSKLKTEDDLYRINTLGFRGEALASIASVSEVTLKTSLGEVGTTVEIKGGTITEVANSDAKKGTMISVRNLFYNTPARLKHLKSLYTELANISDYMNKLALSRPDIKFTLINNGSILLNTDGSNQLLKTINSVYGLAITKKMIEIKGANEDYEVNGYISLPEVHRSTRNNMVTLVNGRIVHNQELNRTINDAYHSYKPDNRYPVIVLNILVDPSLIDVNIHPTKMDIKFSKLESLTDLINSLIKNALTRRNLIPEVKEEKVQPNLIFDSLYHKKETVEPPKKYEEIKLDFDDIAEPVINPDLVSEEGNFETKRMPMLYPVGLVHGTYIICQNEEGMYIIDQHAAKERINYEIYKKKLGNPKKEMTSLLFPLTLEYTASEFLILKANFELIQSLGFEIAEFGLNSIIIKAHPVWLPKGYEEEAIRKILDVILNLEKNFNLERFLDHVAATVACKLSIKANTNITLEEMQNLIDDLRKCDNPFNCPHGRPTTIFYSNYELEKLFKRSGF